MALQTYTLEDKIAALAIEISEARKFRREPGSAMQRHYEILKAISADLRAREELPRNNTLGAMTREMERLLISKVDGASGYPVARMQDLAQLVIGRWPTISQALELFGEESAE